MLTFQLPANFISDLSAQATQMFADLSPVWTLLIGILIAFLIIQELINIFLGGKQIDMEDLDDLEDYL